MTLILQNGPKAVAWLTKHIEHHPGIKATAKQSRCLGCGSILREPLRVKQVDEWLPFLPPAAGGSTA
jgi:hypothetical protein